MAGRPIDEKIVVMNIENDQFKRKATETVSIFGKLKQALSKGGDTNLNKVTKDLGNIKSAADKVSLDSMGRSIDTIAARFSNLGIVATTALTNITNKAVDAGSRMLKSVTTDQVSAGFNEYELKMKSIGTMLSNTEWEGKGLADVQKNLAELNEYADQTVYSFAEMTASIGRFTAAGVGLDDSTIAIKGLGNLAASSGASVEQLNTAMYQVSQGMAAGRFGLEDWNSMVNAGMGGKKTQDALMATAKAMGKNIDMSDGFRLSLQQGWLTSEVFLDTLRQFGEDESMTEMATSVRTFSGMIDALKESMGSGWATTWELIFGDYEEATRFWTGLSKVVGGFFQKSTDSRNNFIRGLIDSGALQAVGQMVRNVMQPVIAIFGAIGDAFRLAFPPIRELGLDGIFTAFSNLTKIFVLNEQTILNLTIAFAGFFSIFDMAFSVVKVLITAMTGLVPSFDGVAEGISTLLYYLGMIPLKFRTFISESEVAEKVLSGLHTAFSYLGQGMAAIGSVFLAAGMMIAQAISTITSGDPVDGIIPKDSAGIELLIRLRDAFSGLASTISNINLSAVGAGFTAFFTGIGSTFDWVKEKFTSVAEWFGNIGNMIADNQGWILAGGGVAATGAIIWKVYETFSKLLDIGGGVADTLEGVSDSLGAFTLGIHAKSLLTIALAVGALTVSLVVLSQLNGKQLAISLGAVTAALTVMVGALAVINKADLSGSFGAIATMIGIAGAVGLLSIALINLSSLNFEQAVTGVGTVTALIAAMAGAMVIMTKFGGTFTVGALQLVAIGAAVGLMAFAVQKIISLNPEEVGSGLTKLAILLGELALFLRLASSQSATLTASGLSIMAISASMLIMVQAIKQLGVIEPTILGQGLATIATLLTGIGLLSKVTNGTSILATSAAMVVLAGAITALIIPINLLGKMQWEVLVQGVTAIVATLGLLGIIVSKMTASLAGAAALVVIAGALNLLILPIKVLGEMQWEHVALGIAGLAGGLLALGGVAAILGVLSPALIALSVAIGIFGVGILAAGAGMKMLGAGLLLLSTLTVGAVTVIATALGAFVTAFTTLLPPIVDLVGKVAVMIGEKIVEIAPHLADTVGKLLVIIMEKIEEYAPKFAEVVLKLIDALLEKLEEYIPKFVDTVEDLVLAILESLGDLIVDGVEIVGDFLIALVKTIGDFIPEFITAGADLIIGFFDGLSADIPRVIDSMTNFILTMVTEMSDTIRNDGQAITSAMLELMGEVILVVITAGADMIQALFGWIPGVSDAASQIGATAEEYIRENFKAGETGTEKGGEFATGLTGTTGDIEAAAAGLSTSAIAGAKSVDTSEAGSWFGAGFIKGLGAKVEEAKIAATTLATTAYNAIKKRLDINSPSREAEALGEFTGDGFSNGLAGSAKSVIGALFGWEKPAEKAATKVSNTVAKTSSAGATKAANAGATSSKKAITKNTKSVQKTAVKSAEDVAKAAADAAKKSFDEKMDTAEYKLEMEEINQEQYIASLKAIRAEYIKWPELVKESSLEIKKAEDDLAKHKAELQKEEFEMAKDILNKKIDREEINMRKTVDAWMELRDAYEENSEFYIEADEEVYNARKALTEELSSINKDYVTSVQEIQEELITGEKEVNDELDKIYADRRQELIDFTGIFDEVAKEFDDAGERMVEGTQLVANLEGQVRAFEEWQKTIASLASKAIDDGLIAELREMGPKALNEIRALNSLSETELQKYSELYKTKSRLATEEADKEMEPLRADASKRIDEMRAESTRKLDQLREEWQGKIQQITGATSSELQGLYRIGSDAIDGLILGMQSKQSEVEAIAAAIGKTVDETVRKTLKIKSPSRVMKALGGYVMDGLIVGVADKDAELQGRMANVAQGIASAFENGNTYYADKFLEDNASSDMKKYMESYNNNVVYTLLGSEKARLAIIEEYGKKYLDHEKKLTDKIKNIREQAEKDFAGNWSYDTAPPELRAKLLDDYTFGMINTATRDSDRELVKLYEDEQTALHDVYVYRQSLFTTQKNLIEQSKKLVGFTLQDERDLYAEFAATHNENFEEHKYWIELRDKLNKEIFESEKKSIEERRKLGKLSLKEELAEYEKYLGMYKAGSEERIYYEQKVRDTKQAIHQELMSLSDEYVNKIKDANKALEEAELDAEKRIGEEKARLIEESQDRLLDAKEEYNRKVDDLNTQSLNDQKNIQQAYDDALKSQTESLFNYTSLFDKVSTSTGVSGRRLLNNLKKQVLTFKNYQQNMNSLANRGIDDGLLESLKEMGPSSAAEIAGLNRLSDSQLKEYVSVWREKSQLASSEATSNLSGMRTDTYNQIQQLQKDTSTQLNVYAQEFVTTTEEIARDINSKHDKMIQEINADLNIIRRDTKAQLEQYATEWESEIAKISSITTNEFDALTATMPDIGENIIKGIEEGLANASGSLMTQVKGITDSISNTIRDNLDIDGTVEGVVSEIGNGKLIESSGSWTAPFANQTNIKNRTEDVHVVYTYDTFENGKMNTNFVEPDLFYTNQSASASSKANSNKQIISSSGSSESKTYGSNQPIVIQNEITFDAKMNGKVVAQETFSHTNNILGNSVNSAMRAMGVK